MKSISLLITGLLISTLSFAQDFKASHNTDDSKIALQGYSPVSYLDLGLAQKGLREFKSTYDGLAYYFTSEDQKKSFESNPQKYLPQYGGYCAFGIYAGAKFRIDPNKFLVKDGKYYLFLYDLEVDAQQLWLNENHNELVQKADANWATLSKK